MLIENLILITVNYILLFDNIQTALNYSENKLYQILFILINVQLLQFNACYEGV
jgi:hypothetical protein